MPLAFQYGMTDFEFWHKDPELLSARQKAYYQDLSERSHLYGYYNYVAVSTALANAFREKGKPTVDYPKKPKSVIVSDKKREVDKDRLERKHRAQMIDLFHFTENGRKKAKGEDNGRQL